MAFKFTTLTWEKIHTILGWFDADSATAKVDGALSAQAISGTTGTFSGDVSVGGSITAVQPYIDVERSNSQAIPNSTATVVEFNNEVSDVNGDFTTDTWTCPEDGTYAIHTNIKFGNNSTGFRGIQILDGGAIIHEIRTPANLFVYIEANTVFPFTADDTVQIKVRQTSGGDLDVTADSYLRIIKIS